MIEFEVGAWTGSSLGDLDAIAQWHDFNRVRSLVRAGGGELMLDVQRRAVAALLDLQPRYAGRIVAVVSHGDVIKALLLYLLGMPIDFLHRLDIAPGRISVAQLGEGDPRVLLVNGNSVCDIR